MRVLVADAVDPAAIGILKAEDALEVVVSDPASYLGHLEHAQALIVRSSVKVTAAVLERAPRLRVIGRAGVGVDNIDCDSATARGVVVMNTPGGNATAVAEHTMALMLSLARSIPLANQSTKSGQWERKRFKGSEVQGKTLGIVGLGSIGREVAQRAKPFGMHVVAYDPFVSIDAARDCGVELLEFEPLLERSDYISLHLSLNPSTAGLVDDDTIAKMKPGVRIVNCARGELIRSGALERALQSGHVAGAALDVHETEPPAQSGLLAHPSVVATPHIGGSTAEAQVKVGMNIARQVRDFLREGVVVNAVNMPSVSAEQFSRLSPFLQLAERLGSVVAQTAPGRPVRVKLTYMGEFGETDAAMIRNSALCGVLNRFLSRKANLINAARIARDRAIGVSEVRRGRTHFTNSLKLALKTEQVDREVEGAVFPDGSPRLLRIDGIYVEALLSGHLLYTRNRDVPGVIGRIGTALGEREINISDFALGRGPLPEAGGPAEAVALIRTDQPLTPSILQRLFAVKAVVFAKAINL